jgi:hypothetical protein
MILVILHHLLNVFVQLANKSGLKKKKCVRTLPSDGSDIVACMQSGCLKTAVAPGSNIPVFRKYVIIIQVRFCFLQTL